MPGEPTDATAPSEGSSMSEPIYCPAQTYAGSRFEPKEYCENEVASEGDLCSEHDAEDRSDSDFENHLESLRKE
jgi:hypothetical protein